jgi:hypothetical protein
MDADEELENAFVQYVVVTGAECSDEFVRVITSEMFRRGHLTCARCGATMCQHVLAALCVGGKHLDHKFAAVVSDDCHSDHLLERVRWLGRTVRYSKGYEYGDHGAATSPGETAMHDGHTNSVAR